jgi:hypothetical protein
MNILPATITAIQQSGSILLVDAEVEGQGFSALLIESVSRPQWLEVGKAVNLVFKLSSKPCSSPSSWPFYNGHFVGDWSAHSALAGVFAFRFKPVVEALVSMPMVLPPSVLGYYMLVLYSPRGLLAAFSTGCSTFGWRSLSKGF